MRRDSGYWTKDAYYGAARQEEKRFVDVVKEDMQRVGVTEEDARDGVK